MKPLLLNGEIISQPPINWKNRLGQYFIKELLNFHKLHGKIATVSAVRPPVRFGELIINGDHVSHFQEKPQAGEGWINGGFFVFEPKIFDFIKDDTTFLEREPLEQLAQHGELMAYKHPGFWQCMDSKKDYDYLQGLCKNGNAPWIKI